MINFETVINYYKYVYNIRGIHTVATGLESTSVVFAYGLGKRNIWKCFSNENDVFVAFCFQIFSAHEFFHREFLIN